MCCTWLAENRGRKIWSKIRHLGTITQLCQAIETKAHIDNRKKKLVKLQYLLHMCSQYGKLRPTNGWDWFRSLGHPYEFQWVSCLGSITARHSSSGRQLNFAALNRGRRLYSAGWPSHLVLAHILVLFFFLAYCQWSKIGCLPTV